MAQKIRLRTIFIIFITLNLIGLIILYSASIAPSLHLYNDPYFFIKKQLLFLFLLAIPGFLFFLIVPEKFLEKLSYIILLANLILLVLVFFPGVSEGKFKRWITVSSFSFQPAEFWKFSFLLFFSFYLTRINFKKFLFFLFFLILGFILILLEKSYSNSFIFLCIGISLILKLPIKKTRLILLLGPVILILLLIGAISASYRIERIKTFLEKNETSTGFWQIDQARNAFISGGLFGKGFGNGKIKTFIPQAYNDAIFTVVGEELGFVGSFIILVIFYVMLSLMLKVSFNSNDFLSLYSFGLLVWVLMHLILHLVTVLGIFIPTGINFPFFSYGGSSLVSLWWAFGVLFRKSLF